MDISLFYSRLAMIGLLVAVGFLLGKIKLLDENFNKSAVNLLLSVLMPAALFSAFPPSYNTEDLNNFFLGLLGGVLVLGLAIILSRLLFNRALIKSDHRFASQFAFIFNNATFLGFPIISETFGSQGLIPFCGFIIVFNIALFSYGVFLFQRKFSLKDLATTAANPNILATLAGLTVFLLALPLPTFLTDSVRLLGQTTTPLSLLCIGFMLSSARLADLIKRPRLLITAALQLTLGPLATFFILKLFGFPPLLIIILTLVQALPTATSLALFAEKYHGDQGDTSELVVASTLLSCATLPLIVLVLPL